ncbi:hypothetical protein JW992_03230 [candidate division KSB1 bacterium]|nr:hypothetical protein [candidate division KSB1 bacterium]
MNDRQAFIDKMTAKMKEWDAKIDKLEAKADSVKADARGAYNKQIKELHNKKAETQQKLKEIEQAGANAWQELQEGLEKSWTTLEDSLKNALSKF